MRTRLTRAIKYYDQSRLHVDEVKTKEFLTTNFDVGRQKMSMIKKTTTVPIDITLL